MGKYSGCLASLVTGEGIFGVPPKAVGSQASLSTITRDIR